jgi:hypothetical protein
MNEIIIDDLMPTEQTSEVVEPTEEIEEIEEVETEEEFDDSEEEQTSETEESEEEETPRSYDELKIKWDDDETNFTDYSDEEIQKYMGLGFKTEEKIKQANAKVNETLSEFNDIAGLYEKDLPVFMSELKDNIFNFIAERDGRNIADVKTEFESKHKSFTELSMNNFLDKYPDLSAKDIPDEVMQQIKLGKDVTSEYENHLLKSEKNSLESKVKDLEKQLKVAKQNGETKKKAFVKKGSGNTNTNDSFLSSIDKLLKG